MTKFLNILKKNPDFDPFSQFWGQKIFFWKITWISSTMPKLRKRLDRRTDGRTVGGADPIS